LTGWKAKAVNNWEIFPLVHVMDGALFTVVTGADNSLTDIGNDPPNLTNSSMVYTHTKILSGQSTNAQYVNASAFTPNAIGTFGDTGANAFRGPKFLQVDSALSRVFPLRDTLALDHLYLKADTNEFQTFTALRVLFWMRHNTPLSETLLIRTTCPPARLPAVLSVKPSLLHSFVISNFHRHC